MGELSDLPNIGKVVEAQLMQVGIHSAEELKRIGAREAWLRIQKIDASACLHRLMALEGAIEDVKKSMLDDGVKAELKAFCQNHRKQEGAL